MSDLKPYPEYKDSGVEWLGDVPEHWSVQPAKAIASVRTSNVDKKTYEGELPVLLCNYTDVYYNDKIVAEMGFMQATASASQISTFGLRAGDTVITKDSESPDDIGLSALVRDDLDNVVCGYHLAIYRPIDIRFGSFIKRVFDSAYTKALLHTSAQGVTRVGLPKSALRDFQVPVPPPDEASLIASFLDHETAEIDAFIADQEELIRLLNERRAATITQAVTKGLDRDVPMKDSGVEWLGEVPTHWDVRPLKAVASLQTGITLGKTYDDSVELPYLRVANVQIGYVDLTDLKTIRVSAEVARASTLQLGDVLMTEGGDRDKLGRGCLWDAPVSPCLHQNHVFAVRAGQSLLNRFLVYVLDAVPARTYFHMTGKQTTNLAATNSTLVKNFRMALPSLHEQQQIGDYLDRETAEIDATIADAKEAIELSKERRAALISAAVTGKIDVRDHPAARGAA